jgi:electron transfer flavoprotein alpha subunit
MEFLKELLGDELYSQLESKVNEHNGNEANKDKQIKIGNLGSGEYVGKGKYDALQQAFDGKNAELLNANKLISELQKATKGDADLQSKISAYEKENADLQAQLQETEKKYAFDVLLMEAGVTDKDEREFLAYKYEKKLIEEGKSLELDENKHIKGGEAIIDSLKTTNPKAFESAGGGNKKVLGDNKLREGEGEREVEPKDLAEALKMQYEKNN